MGLYIYQFSRENGEGEYIVLTEQNLSQSEIEDYTKPGFTLDQKYDTYIDTNFGSLPLDRSLTHSF